MATFFSGDFFYDLSLRDFLSDELLLKKGRRVSGAPKLTRMCVECDLVGFAIWDFFFAEKHFGQNTSYVWV